MWSWIACMPEETERSVVALAAADLVADIMARLASENVANPVAEGKAEYAFEANEDVTDPDWAGTVKTNVTWAGDPDGSCACRGDCAASRWSFTSLVDVRFRHDTSLTWCSASTDAPEGDPPDVDLIGTLAGSGGLGPSDDDFECPGAWPTWQGTGALTVPGLPDTTYDVDVSIEPDGPSDDVTLTIDGEVRRWSYTCGV